MGSGRGLVVMVLDSGIQGRGFDPHTEHGSLWSLGNLIYPNLPEYIQLQMSSNIVGKVPATEERPPG